LREAGIGVQVNYLPAYWHPAFQKLGYRRGLCPNAEEFYRQEISLPIHMGLTDLEQKYIIESLLTAVEVQ
jgi:dTDP-4-amino-4,6-dideoxygalactose transaminase